MVGPIAHRFREVDGTLGQLHGQPHYRRQLTIATRGGGKTQHYTRHFYSLAGCVVAINRVRPGSLKPKIAPVIPLPESFSCYGELSETDQLAIPVAANYAGTVPRQAQATQGIERGPSGRPDR